MVSPRPKPDRDSARLPRSHQFLRSAIEGGRPEPRASHLHGRIVPKSDAVQSDTANDRGRTQRKGARITNSPSAKTPTSTTLFSLLFLEKIEQQIPTDQLTFLKNYPPSQAALARLTTEGWGDRFEMYWKGMELANAYHELNNPKIQRERSNEDLQKRQHLGRPAVDLDEQFFQSLESGAPPSAGIALGLERLFMALTDRKSLAEIRLFPMK